MSDPIRIDSHVHIFQEAAEGTAAKENYEIWEYGAQEQVAISALPGTVDDLLGAMAKAHIERAVAVNIWVPDEEREGILAGLPASLDEAERNQALARWEAGVRDRFMDFNRWGCRVAREHPEVISYVCVDPMLLPGEDGAAHLRDMVDNEGARGLKLHGPVHGVAMGDERLGPSYQVCRDAGLPVIGHSGPDRGGRGVADPRAFAAALEAFPEVTFVLAHMGGATWSQALEIAETHANAYFDCCEIIEWTHSENGPSDAQLGQLIKDIGPERVMMGSDFPWYDLDHTVDRVMELPVLSNEEKHGILGANAVRILGL
jgi:predicted TIM-barrel fold metal-dependent hydrolase